VSPDIAKEARVWNGVDSSTEKNRCKEVEEGRKKNRREKDGEEECVLYVAGAATEALSGVSHDDKRRAASM
jgi:hypothetical protein